MQPTILELRLLHRFFHPLPSPQIFPLPRHHFSHLPSLLPPQRNGETVRGEDTPTLRIEDVTPSDAGVYQVHVTNIAGTAASDAITMTVRMPPAITSHPASKNGVVGRSIEFAVSVADPSQPDLEFVWQVRGPSCAPRVG